MRSIENVSRALAKIASDGMTEQLYTARQLTTDNKIDRLHDEVLMLRGELAALDKMVDKEKDNALERERTSVALQAANRRLVYMVIFGGAVTILGQIYLNLQGVT